MSEVVYRPARPSDWDRWLPLWQGYHEFYKNNPSAEVTRTTWARFFQPEEPMHAWVAESGEDLLGLVHFIFHRNTWMLNPVCYLQDLFTAPASRGKGVGRGLIEAVYAQARDAGSPRVYWLTHESNAEAMLLYDRIADRSGFVQYRKAMV